MSAKYRNVGVGRQNEVSPQRAWHDMRRSSERLGIVLRTPMGCMILYLLLVMLAALLPAFVEVCVGAAVAAYFFILKAQRNYTLPAKMPRQSDIPDPLELSPAGKIQTAKGTFFLGNDRDTDEEVWLSNRDAGVHMLVLGTTGSGKALRLTEPVLTERGWRAMGELRLGERLVHPRGGLSTIVGVFPQGVRELWRLRFVDGRSIEVSGDHLWEIDWGGITRVIDTAALAELVAEFPSEVTIPLHAVAPESAAMHRLNSELDAVGRLAVSEDDRSVSLRVRARNEAHMRSIIAAAHEAGCIAAPVTEGRSYGVFLRMARAGATLRLAVSQVARTGSSEPVQCIKIDAADGLFIAGDWIVTHNTEMLLGIVQNSLNQGSGLLFVDGKAQDKIAFKIQDLVRARGRDDDLLVLNFMTGARDIVGRQSSKITNTMNPFSYGSAGMISQIVVGLMSSGNGGTDMWADRAISFVEGLSPALVFLRDNYGLLLDVNEYRKYFEIERVEKLCWDGNDMYPGIDQVLDPLKNYLVNVPGYDKNKSSKRGGQGDDTKMQWGYITMQLTRAFTSLADTYGHIVRVPLGEVYFPDVVKNRRIVVVMLPSLEKTPAETANIGKIIVTALRNIMAEGLGSVLEGDRERLESEGGKSLLPPFVVVLDEYGYYAVKGFAVAFAQARCAPLDTLVATPDGWARMGDLTENSGVLSPYGHVALILSITDRISDDVCCIELINGCKTRATKDHLWQVKLPDGSVIVTETRLLMPMRAKVPVMRDGRMEYIDVRGVEPCGREPVRCFLLDDEHHLYVTDDGIVSHNSLGFVCIVGGQDLASFQRESKEEAVSICGNTRIKAFGSVEDPDQTMDFVVKTAGKAVIAKNTGYEANPGAMGTGYADEMKVHFETLDRINPSDIKEQTEGQFHFVWRSRVIRAQTYYVNPPRVKSVRLNHFVMVAAPTAEQLDQIESASSGIGTRYAESNLYEEIDAQPLAAIECTLQMLAQMAHLGPIERGIAAVVAANTERERSQAVFMERLKSGAAVGDSELFSRIADVADSGISPADLLMEAPEIDPLAAVTQAAAGSRPRQDGEVPTELEGFEQMNVFVPARGSRGSFGEQALAGVDTGLLEGAVSAGEGDAIPALLDYDATMRGVESIELGLGATPEQAGAAAREVVQSIEDATRYPSAPPAQKSEQEIVSMFDQLLGALEDES